MENENYIAIIFTSYFIGSVVFSTLINFIFLRFAQNLGIRNKIETGNRWNPLQKPAFGGISFYIIFLLSFTSYTVFFPTDIGFPNRIMFGLIAATALAFLMGLADDAFNTRPYLKLGVQIASGLLLIYSGTFIQVFDSEALNYIITIVWVVGMMNSINMLDNMDAITSIISIVVLLATIIIMVFTGNYANIYFYTLLGVLASLIGFLFFNWHPSKLFMGDTGSQFLGVFLAFVGIRYFWNIQWGELNDSVFGNFMLILAIFALPLIDTTTVVINRLLRGQSPMVGGKDHTTHSLSHIGLSDKQIAFIFGIISLVFSGMVVFGLITGNDYKEILELGILSLFLIVFILFFILNRSYLKSLMNDA